MNCTVYSLFQYSYLYAFYKPNNITKLSLKVKSYFQSYPSKATDKYSTLGPHGASRMKRGWKKLYQVLYHCFKISKKKATW